MPASTYAVIFLAAAVVAVAAAFASERSDTPHRLPAP